ncbi:MAG: hydrolase 1, exosortase A system-associated [Gammaproteobacteria bacterium]|nr:hydrolase 1, exosortase A system-associated [Gammaproteobacteria bacterium]
MNHAGGEQALTFGCETEALIGVLHPGRAHAQVGVVLVVGGPQYRVGSHRQFVLLARSLAQAGIPVLRFDYRGMGDSSGAQRSFESVDNDIRSAIDVLCQQVRSVQKVMLWGLCDAASAALFYAHQDPRVAGLVLLNPWVRTEAGMARAYLKHYYLRRMVSGEFWKKLLSGQWSVRASFTSLIELTSKLRKSPASSELSAPEKPPAASNVPVTTAASLPDAMLTGWERFNGKVLLILSGNNDYVADEFRDLVATSRRWRKVLQRASTTRHDYSDANHTFSRSACREQVADWTLAWINENTGSAR